MRTFLRNFAAALFVTVLSFFVIGLASLLAGWLTDVIPLNDFPKEVVQAATVILVLLVYFFSLIFYFSRRRARLEVAPLEADADNLRRMVGPGSSPQVVARANAAELRKNFAIVRSHARYAFIASVTALSVGLISVLAAIAFYFQPNSSVSLSTVSGISSVISQFISGGFFLLYRGANKDLRRITQSLEQQDNLATMLDEAENIRDQDKRDEVIRALILSILTPTGTVA